MNDQVDLYWRDEGKPRQWFLSGSVRNRKVKSSVVFEWLHRKAFTVKFNFAAFPQAAGNIHHSLAHKRYNITLEVGHIEFGEVWLEWDFRPVLIRLASSDFWLRLVAHVVSKHLQNWWEASDCYMKTRASLALSGIQSFNNTRS